MITRLPFRTFVATALVVTICAAQQSLVKKVETGYVATGTLYGALVRSKDGALVSLKVQGEEFLREHGGNPRGAYLFQKGAFGLEEVTHPQPNVVVAKGEKAEVTYTFSPDGIRWRVRNLTEEKLTTLIAFDPALRAVRDAFGQYEKMPASFGGAKKTVWFGKASKLEIAGGGRVWGPWGGEKLQIWQYDLNPKEDHTTLFTPGLATKKELEDIQIAMDYVAVPPTDPDGPMWDLEKLSAPPAMRDAAGFDEKGVKAIFYDGPSYKGRTTRVFAWLGVPDAPKGTKVPGMVLIHGGGGTAYADWVRLWNAKGYAAIAMDTCGGTPGPKQGGSWPRHEDSGPSGWGGYAQIDWPRKDQWAYHAVASVILANSLLRSLPQVDSARIGMTGISWGGYLCSMVAGVDSRFRFAVPVYGCGFTTEHAFAGRVNALGEKRAARWMRWWDPSSYLADARMPMLWVSGSNDFAYTFNALQKSYRLPKTPRTLCIRVRMGHSHTAGWAPREIHAFAESLLNNASPLIYIMGQGREDDTAWTTYTAASPVVKAELNYTCATGRWQARRWETIPAEIVAGCVSAKLPPGTTVYYFNLTDQRGLLVSTEHVERTQ